MLHGRGAAPEEQAGSEDAEKEEEMRKVMRLGVTYIKEGMGRRKSPRCCLNRF